MSRKPVAITATQAAQIQARCPGIKVHTQYVISAIDMDFFNGVAGGNRSKRKNRSGQAHSAKATFFKVVRNKPSPNAREHSKTTLFVRHHLTDFPVGEILPRRRITDYTTVEPIHLVNAGYLEVVGQAVA
mgnify:CR=1 FL=1